MEESQAEWMKKTLFGEMMGAEKDPVRRKADEKAEKENDRESRCKLATENRGAEKKKRGGV